MIRVAHTYRYLEIPADDCGDLFVFQAWPTPFKNNNILMGFRYPDKTEKREFLVFSYHSIYSSGPATDPSFLITSPFQYHIKKFL